MSMQLGLLAGVVLFLLAACADADDIGVAPDESPAASSTVTTAVTTDPPGTPQPCADVVDARAERSGDTYRFDVTVRSGDTGWEKYADSWVVRTVDGTVLGERVLLHPHETEQPFTRSLSGVAIPDGVDQVVIAANDSVNGFCGETLTLALDR